MIFGILVYKGDLFDRLETPLYKSLKMYEDNPTGTDDQKVKKEAFKSIWNTVQMEVNRKQFRGGREERNSDILSQLGRG